ncbi:hypothetical protein SAMN05216174_106248 [Actinokineospora iranica]|uniref:PPE family protein n=2 Tax=Actinokineospora iranica TaxID=1271860 RepID=A0A1G6RC62_9PSEU|nr:hypothetical protein SAMN05216174_106248 [Actinokineospora iranica]
MAGLTGQQIFDNFHNAQGVQERHEAADGLKKLLKEYEQCADDVLALTTSMDSMWQGDASGAAQRGAAPLIVEHRLASPEFGKAQDLTGRQLDSFEQAKNSVQPIPEQPKEPGFWDDVTSLGGASEDYEGKLREYNAANEHNVAVMRAYEDASGYNASGMPTEFGEMAPPPGEVAVEQPPPPSERVDPPGRRETPTTTGGGDSAWRTTGSLLEDDSVTPSQVTAASGWTAPGAVPAAGVEPGPVRTPVGPPPGGSGYPVQPPGMVPPGMVPPGMRPPGNSLRGLGGGPGGGGGGAGGRGGGFGPGGAGARGAYGGGGGGGFGPNNPGGSVSGTGPGAGARSGALAGAGMGADDGHGAQNRGAAAGGGRGGAGGPMGGGGGGGQGGEDSERTAPSYLLEADPDALFGTDEITAPPVIGE